MDLSTTLLEFQCCAAVPISRFRNIIIKTAVIHKVPRLMSQSDYEVLAAFTDKRIDKNIVIPPHLGKWHMKSDSCPHVGNEKCRRKSNLVIEHRNMSPMVLTPQAYQDPSEAVKDDLHIFQKTVFLKWLEITVVVHENIDDDANGGWLCQDEAEYLLPVTGCQKFIEVDEECKMSVFCERHVTTEIAAGALVKSEGITSTPPPQQPCRPTSQYKESSDSLDSVQESGEPSGVATLAFMPHP
ncbi:hypothetical protein U0070_027401 [Myodes glareolus]|uniref:Uncharacterized protein n=1 Tax=Myodes glareolus TaxID=447135 RepID=A0AAW0J8T1_MYOGA